MGPDFEPADSIRRYQIASPSIIGIRAVEVAYEMIERAGIALIEQKAAKGTELMIDLFTQWLEPLGFEVASPAEASLRGGHIILTHPDARQIAYAMRKISKVIPDYREPNAIRVAISPLATSYREVYEGFLRLRDLVQSGEYENVVQDQNRVT
jgi:kynureninase